MTDETKSPYELEFLEVLCPVCNAEFTTAYNSLEASQAAQLAAAQERIKALEGALFFVLPYLEGAPFDAAHKVRTVLAGTATVDTAQERIAALEGPARGLIEYRKRNTLNFQLEKADTFIKQLEAALAGVEPARE